MPPFGGTTVPSNGSPPKPQIIILNVGGQLFQTTPQTLTLSGPKSLLTTIASTDYPSDHIHFIDRDPDIFSVLLSLLRTGHLPSKASSFDLQDLVSEAQFYDLDPLLMSALSNASQFDAFDLRKSVVLPLSGRDSPSVIATTPFGSVHVAHGSKITSFNWSLRRKSTILTCFPAVDSLLALSKTVAAAGATDFSGLQILDLQNGSVKKTLNWASLHSNCSNSTVQGIGSSPDFLFGSFESSRRNSSSIVAFDLQGETFQPVVEIGRQEIYGAELDSGIPATKLKWVSSFNLLMSSGSHAGPFGLLGDIRLWDVRSSNLVWELREKIDCFADVTVSDNLSAIFKVGMNSGEIFMADLRKLSLAEPWVCLGDGRKTGLGKKEGNGCKIESHGDQVFCSKGGDLEMWSEVMMGSQGWSREDGLGERVMRRNLVGRVKDGGESKITQIGFGGNRMVLTRKDQQSVEVWESSVR